jgi:two-component system phosphate regulon sensor histidine kinase PhoR
VRRDFITNVSHELRTPLAGIKASAETLKEGALRDPEAAAEFVRHIENETDRLAQMVEELLELSRIESGAAPLRMGVVPVVPLLQAASSASRRKPSGPALTLALRWSTARSWPCGATRTVWTRPLGTSCITPSSSLRPAGR